MYLMTQIRDSPMPHGSIQVLSLSRVAFASLCSHSQQMSSLDVLYLTTIIGVTYVAGVGLLVHLSVVPWPVAYYDQLLPFYSKQMSPVRINFTNAMRCNKD